MYKKLRMIFIIFFINLISLKLYPCANLVLKTSGNFNLSSNQKTIQKTITVEKKSGTCDFIIQFRSQDQNGNYRNLKMGDNTIQYGLYKDSSQQSFLTGNGSEKESTIHSSFTQEGFESLSYPIFLSLTPNQIHIPVGTYQDMIELELVKIINNQKNTNATHRLNVIFTQLPFYEIEVSFPGANKGTHFQRLDFGSLVTGKTMEFDLIVKANIQHKLIFKSMNKGYMQHLKIHEQMVPYTLNIENQNIDLQSGESKWTMTPSDPSDIERYRGQVQIQNTNQSISGQYQDFLSVIIEAL